ncbi:GNAT family protein [Paenibacillaceae sp. P-4]|uniref:GNAT family N-acetyltransferase n=1 Tax=Paenibacillaceae bacterium P-4 TaxID=3160969 RepID=UPI0032E82D8B
MNEKQVVRIGSRVRLRNITLDDIHQLYSFIYGEAAPEWKKWDAPYYPLESKSYEEYQEEMMRFLDMDPKPTPEMLIEVNGEIIGFVSYYWEHRPSNWLEIGIVIYNPQYWNGGYGTEALRLWIDHLFAELPLVRIGLTTWSGNERMIRVAEKLGMTCEGRLRKCRLYNGLYYDSIRMGMLREEWEQQG